MDEPLEQFQDWYHSRERAGLDSQSEYVKLRQAFFAGHRARPAEPIEPSRDALTARRLEKTRQFQEVYGVPPEKVKPPLSRAEVLRRYAPPQPQFRVRDDEHVRFLPSGPVIDTPYTETEVDLARSGYIQHGTITGRIGPAHPAFPQRTPVPEDQRREPVAGPDQATMQRIVDELRDKGESVHPSPRPYAPSNDTNPGFPAVRDDVDTKMDHIEQVWGAPGPVQSIPQLMEDENG